MINTDPVVKMDQCHLDLIYGLGVAQKPKKVLELGMGSGVVTDVLLKAFRYNDIPLDLTCVDNWMDWNFKKPAEVSHYEESGVKVVTSAERDFVLSCKEKYDLIISDADHDRSQEWFEQSLFLLKSGGIIIYHDVTNPSFPDLHTHYSLAKQRGSSYFLFNHSSRKDEGCERGLLIISNGSDCPMLASSKLKLKFILKKWIRKLKTIFPLKD